jgi:hypothetical protein
MAVIMVRLAQGRLLKEREAEVSATPKKPATVGRPAVLFGL